MHTNLEELFIGFVEDRDLLLSINKNGRSTSGGMAEFRPELLFDSNSKPLLMRVAAQCRKSAGDPARAATENAARALSSLLTRTVSSPDKRTAPAARVDQKEGRHRVRRSLRRVFGSDYGSKVRMSAVAQSRNVILGVFSRQTDLSHLDRMFVG